MSESTSAELPAELEEMIERHMERLREANRWSSAAAARAVSTGEFAAAGAGRGAPAPGPPSERPDPRVVREVAGQSDRLHAELRREAAEVLERMDALLRTDLPAGHRAAVIDARHWWTGYVDKLAKLD
ncbi:hypothetical protein [Actinomadura montaniterrae]|uniref:Uncharacterized protein n=1 Tax=Actinomadura montaniterrae TaxID=1803903 RepID=A0A6L3VLS4_9ACTN|nr:hypothetical protein [Actinomadura montaniterrae]KAB2373311.1 hypothetical protein F9B16_28705 [Actinomadura montaniterrae]